MAVISRETMISTSYGPKSGGGYFQRRPGAPLVPLAQVRYEETGFDGLRGIYGLSGGGRPDWKSIDGSQPKTDEAKVVAALKTRGIPTPTRDQVIAILNITTPDDPAFDEDLDKLLGQAATEQKAMESTVATDDPTKRLVDPVKKASNTLKNMQMSSQTAITFRQMVGTVVGATLFFLAMDWLIQKAETSERRSRAA
jgi:hypothetical protein